MDRLTFYPIADSYALVAIVGLALLALWYWVPAPLERRRRTIVSSLRIAFMVLLIIAMLRPTLVRKEHNRRSATLVVLADDSRSMTVPDAAGGRKTRYAAMRDALGSSRAQLRALAENVELVPIRFSKGPEPLTIKNGQLDLPEEPAGQETAIGATLQQVLQSESGKRLLGIVLLSDGASRAYAPRDIGPQNLARKMGRLGVPLYTVTFGQSGGLIGGKDLAIESLELPETIFLNNRLEVKGQIRIDGYANRDIPVELFFETLPDKMSPVAAALVRAESNSQIVPVTLKYQPESVGQFKVTLAIKPQPGELVTTNNRKSSFLRVLAGGLRVLYIEGFPPRRETKFLRRALDASREIEVDYLSLSANTKPGKLIERFEKGEYQVFILGDVDSSRFTAGELKSLSEAVQNGAGLLLLGGFHSFGPGGYAETELAKIIPIEMSRLDRQKPNSPVRKDLHLPGPVKIRPSQLGRSHYLTQLTDELKKDEPFWAQLPALSGANRFGRTKPGSLVLLKTEKGEPLLVTSQYGNGRVAAWAADTTWRWVMQGFDRAHLRFWRQMVLWLADQESLGQGDVRLTLSHRSIAVGQPLEIHAMVGIGPGESSDAPWNFGLTVIGPDDKKEAGQLTRKAPQSDSDQMAKADGTFDKTDMPGDYSVRLEVKKGDETIGTAESRFLVAREDLELDRPVAEVDGMENLAMLSGGEAVLPEQLGPLWNKLGRRAETFTETIQTQKTYWDRWWFLALLVVALSAEWFLRKRWGQV
jgi:uncharacterized membrane protein